MEITIDDKLYKDIFSYCDLNGIGFLGYVNKLLKEAYMIDKYGEKPGIGHVERQYEPPLPSNEDKVEKEETTVVDGGVMVEVVDNNKTAETEKVEVEDDIDIKNLELNKALKDGVFNDELSDETPVVDKPVVTKRKLKRKLT